MILGHPVDRDIKKKGRRRRNGRKKTSMKKKTKKRKKERWWRKEGKDFGSLNVSFYRVSLNKGTLTSCQYQERDLRALTSWKW